MKGNNYVIKMDLADLLAAIAYSILLVSALILAV